MQASYDDLVEVEAYTEDVSKAERLKRAIEAFHQATKRWGNSQKLLQDGQQNNQISRQEDRAMVTDSAHKYAVCRTTLQRRYQGVFRRKTQAHKDSQRLTKVEEESLVKGILRPESGDFPPYIDRVQ